MTRTLEGDEWSAARPSRTLPRERPGTHFTGGWVDPRAGLNWWKISSPPGFDPGPSSPYSIVIPTELPGLLPIFGYNSMVGERICGMGRAVTQFTVGP